MACPQNDRHNRPDNLNQSDEVGIFTHLMPFKMGNPLQPSVYVFFIHMNVSGFFTLPYINNNRIHITLCIIWSNNFLA
jgi:hypothetical protein